MWFWAVWVLAGRAMKVTFNLFPIESIQILNWCYRRVNHFLFNLCKMLPIDIFLWRRDKPVELLTPWSCCPCYHCSLLLLLHGDYYEYNCWFCYWLMLFVFLLLSSLPLPFAVVVARWLFWISLLLLLFLSFSLLLVLAVIAPCCCCCTLLCFIRYTASDIESIFKSTNNRLWTQVVKKIARRGRQTRYGRKTSQVYFHCFIMFTVYFKRIS